jgi:adenylylsulfate kinase
MKLDQEMTKALRKTSQKTSQQASQACVIWLTGLSGAGKTTIADEISRILNERGISYENLDGDRIRALFPKTGFSREERNSHICRVGWAASLLEKHGVTAIVSLVSPYRDSRDWVRDHCQKFIEVYVATPLEECERRDPKGLYRKARRGEIRSFTGVDDPYEAPLKPDLVIDTRGNQEERVREIALSILQKAGIG